MKTFTGAHTTQYLRWRERKNANAGVLGWFGERAKTVLHRTSPAGMLFVEDRKDPLSDWEERFLKIITGGAQPSAGCVTLFEVYVHDSRAGFRILGEAEKRLERQAVATYKETSRMIVDGATRVGHDVHDAGLEEDQEKAK
ncbi:MAG: hypothetical protein RSH52_00175 [Janthinobacterium sp.]